MLNDYLTLLLVRHGQSESNAGLTDDPDSRLTPLGEEQAHRVGEWLNQHYAGRIAGLYTSNMRRAVATAAAIGKAIGHEPEAILGFHEAELWLPEYLPRFEDPISALTEPLPPVHPGYAKFETRVRESVATLLRRHPYGTIILVSHGGVMGTVIRALFGSWRVSVYTHNTGITKVTWYRGRWYLEYINRQEHLIDCGGYAL